MTLLLRRVSAGKGLLYGYCYIQQHPQFDETQKSLSAINFGLPGYFSCNGISAP